MPNGLDCVRITEGVLQHPFTAEARLFSLNLAVGEAVSCVDRVLGRSASSFMLSAKNSSRFRGILGDALVPPAPSSARLHLAKAIHPYHISYGKGLLAAG